MFRLCEGHVSKKTSEWSCNVLFIWINFENMVPIGTKNGEIWNLCALTIIPRETDQVI